jgi:predicted dehydrogenase
MDFPSWISGWKSPDWSPGEGMMYALGSHSLDQALLLFGRPATVTGFYRSVRGVESKTDDSFTIILQYSGEKKNLLVTVKSTIVATMQNPLKYFVRGYDGSFIKYGEDVQANQVMLEGLTTASPGFATEPEETNGLLTTKEKFHESQVLKNGKWVGNFPSFKGDYEGYYKDVVKAIRGEGELVIKPEQSRGGIRIIELARESADKGRTLPFE